MLSGGERARLLLARALAKPSNLLVLDEPTNDLDLETLDLLQELLADYPGTLLLVSHDRDFLDRVVHERDRVGRRRPLARIRRRLHRHAGPAQRGGHRWRGRARRTRQATGRLGRQATATRPGGTASTQKRKFSFKEKHALETLPKTIAKLEAEIGRLSTVLADPATARDATSSPPPPLASAPHKPHWPPPRSSGSSWKCCGKSWAPEPKLAG